jgi:hypothetical protein
MLIKRIEKDGIIKALYESSNVMASTYNTSNSSLVIVFGTGVGYKYDDVSAVDYAKFELADSQGKIFNKHIKQHTYNVIGEYDLEALKKEMKATKADEIAKINRELKEFAQEIAEHEELNEEALANLVQLYNIRKQKIDE